MDALKWSEIQCENRLFKWRIHQGYVFAFKSNRNQFHYDQSELEIYLNETQKSDVEAKRKAFNTNEIIKLSAAEPRQAQGTKAEESRAEAEKTEMKMLLKTIFLPSHTPTEREGETNTYASQWESSRKKDIALLNIMFSSGSRIKTKHCKTDTNKRESSKRCDYSEYAPYVLSVDAMYIKRLQITVTCWTCFRLLCLHIRYIRLFFFSFRFVLFRTANIKYRSPIVDHLHHAANQRCACISVEFCWYL